MFAYRPYARDLKRIKSKLIANVSDFEYKNGVLYDIDNGNILKIINPCVVYDAFQGSSDPNCAFGRLGITH